MDFTIKQKDGFDGKIGELVSMMAYSRDVLLEDMKDLSQSDLDVIAYEGANSIGSLLMHIASVEFVHQVITHENRDLTDEEMAQWKTPLFLGPEASKEIRGHSVDYYSNRLAEMREKTLSILSSKNEEWLFEEDTWGNGVSHNKYWLWYHVMEDEINHRGQIRVIRECWQIRISSCERMVRQLRLLKFLYIMVTGTLISYYYSIFMPKDGVVQGILYISVGLGLGVPYYMIYQWIFGRFEKHEHTQDER